MVQGKIMRIALSILFAVVALWTIAPAQQSATPAPRTVSVRGEGTVMADPDQVRLQVQIATRTESASSAMSQVNSKTRDVLSVLRNIGVDPKDIQTSHIGVSPVYDYQRNIQPPPIVGYAGTSSLNILFRGTLMDKTGDFIDRAVKAGATGFGSLSFESSRVREIQRDALRKAADDARARAQVLAQQLGATLGPVTSIAESVEAPQPMYRNAAMLDAATAPAPVMSGELAVTATVHVVFALQ